MQDTGPQHRRAQVRAAAQADLSAATLLTTLLRAAALSSRASTTIQPVPLHPAFTDMHGEADVFAIRAALPELRATLANVRQRAQQQRQPSDGADSIAPAHASSHQSDNDDAADRGDGDARGVALLEAALFGAAEAPPQHPAQQPSASDRFAHAVRRTRLVRRGVARFSRADCSGRRVAQRFEVSGPLSVGAAQAGSDEELTAFHGSGVENWYAIVHGGLRVLPDAYASHGRVYGDGVYLAEDFDTAASFAPFATAAEYGAGDDDDDDDDDEAVAGGLCVVGEFAVTRNGRAGDTLQSRGVKHGDDDGVPDGYVVVTEPRAVRLRAVHVLWGGRERRRRAGRQSATGGVRGAVGGSVDWIVAIVVLYVAVLLWMRVA